MGRGEKGPLRLQLLGTMKQLWGIKREKKKKKKEKKRKEQKRKEKEGRKERKKKRKLDSVT